MISFSPVFILVPYGLYLVLHFFLGLVNIKHIVRTGSTSLFSFSITIIFLLYTLLVLSLTWGVIESFPWSEPITFGVGGFFGGAGNFGTE